jgi:hypothetical protein
VVPCEYLELDKTRYKTFFEYVAKCGATSVPSTLDQPLDYSRKKQGAGFLLRLGSASMWFQTLGMKLTSHTNKDRHIPFFSTLLYTTTNLRQN